nr:hypothetical protein [Tanacetum cinerariifolium]
NKELNTNPEKESDEFIKSSVKDLVPIPSESEDTSGSDSECILPSCDDFYPINILEEKAVTFSNPLFIQMTILPLVMTSRYPMRMFWKTMIAPDLKASRARGFVHRPLELQSLAYGNLIS